MIDPERQEEIYTTLNQAWRYEISVKSISDIKGKENFEKDVRSLVAVLENQIANAKQDIARQIYKKTLKNVVYMLEDLMDLRAMKILSSTKNLKKVKESSLFPIEIEYYRQLYTAFRGYSKTKNMLINGANSHKNLTLPEEIPKSITEIEKEKENSEETENSDSSKEIIPENIDPPIIQAKSNLNLEDNEDDEEFPDVDWDNLDTQLEAAPPIIKHKASSNSSLHGSDKHINQQKKKNLRQQINKQKVMSSTLAISHPNLISLRILKEMPALVDEHLRVYGPFKSGDLANIPIKNAEVLIEEHLAEPINPK